MVVEMRNRLAGKMVYGTQPRASAPPTAAPAYGPPVAYGDASKAGAPMGAFGLGSAGSSADYAEVQARIAATIGVLQTIAPEMIPSLLPRMSATLALLGQGGAAAGHVAAPRPAAGSVVPPWMPAGPVAMGPAPGGSVVMAPVPVGATGPGFSRPAHGNDGGEDAGAGAGGAHTAGMRRQMEIRELRPGIFCDVVVELVNMRADSRYVSGIVTDYTRPSGPDMRSQLSITFWDHHGAIVRKAGIGAFLHVINLKVKRNAFGEVEGAIAAHACSDGGRHPEPDTERRRSWAPRRCAPPTGALHGGTYSSVTVLPARHALVVPMLAYAACTARDRRLLPDDARAH